MAKNILVTGTAGFIGFHVANALLKRGDHVVGLDNINDYYDVGLKYARLEEAGIGRDGISWHQQVQSTKYHNYKFVRMNLEDREALMELCKRESFDIVINLAAQAGVRYSIENPDAYVQSNVVGFLNILEAARSFKVKHLVYASSSSVYGMNTKMPFSVTDNVDHPISLYAATKKSNELMAHTYSHLYRIPTTGLRFFTVYGPWGRPDMAYYLFADAINQGKPIKVFNNGKMKRDFTYIDDIVTGVINVADNAPNAHEKINEVLKAPYGVYNIGNNNPVELITFIQSIENAMGIKSKMEFLDMQPGDVPATWADIDDLVLNFGYRPNTDLNFGIKLFVDWFKRYKGL